MKLPLPEKVITSYGDGETSSNYYSPEAKAINQLIDYLAEKEVPEGIDPAGGQGGWQPGVTIESTYPVHRGTGGAAGTRPIKLREIEYSKPIVLSGTGGSNVHKSGACGLDHCNHPNCHTFSTPKRFTAQNVAHVDGTQLVFKSEAEAQAARELLLNL
jgi:hypothetical protein